MILPCISAKLKLRGVRSNTSEMSLLNICKLASRATNRYDAHGGLYMGLDFGALRRRLLLGFIWLIALGASARAVTALVEQQQLRHDVARLAQQREQQRQDYLKLREENMRLATDRPTQVELLKHNFGYTELDETPIVITLDDSLQEQLAASNAADTESLGQAKDGKAEQP
jgi:hypothetical protein